MREYDIPPNFLTDLAHGEQGEETIKEFLQDLAQGSIEIKTDRYRNGRIVIETNQKPAGQNWKPSGINITTATWWVYQYHLDGAFITIRTDRLKRYLRANKHRYNEQTKQTMGTTGDNPTKGWLLQPEEVQDMMLNKAYDSPHSD